jgi:TRAP-type C4-dicarboxylate transport system permease small subunit
MPHAFMNRFFKQFIKLTEWWASVLLVLMVVLVCLGVLFRYVIGASLAWYDEFASYLLVWLTFFGAISASYHNRHINFDTFINRCLPETKRKLEIVAELFVLGFHMVLFYYGWLLVWKMGDETAISLVWVKMGWVYGVLPITGGLMLLISVHRLFHLIGVREQSKGVEPLWSGSSSE